VIVALHNSSENDFEINHGERIAQLVLAPVFTPEVEIVSELSGTSRGEGGFGSTNK
jgi:dUTP pyrophosphatase